MDYHWFELCKAGEAQAIEKLIQAYQKEVYRLALSILDDPDEAEEGTQDAFIAVLRALDSFHGGSSLKTWIATPEGQSAIKVHYGRTFSFTKQKQPLT